MEKNNMTTTMPRETIGKHKAVFLDRDGTIIKSNPYEPNCSSPKDVELLPRAAEAIKLLNSNSFFVIVVTNQWWVGEGYFDEQMLFKINLKMQKDLQRRGGYLDDIFYCPHRRDEECNCSKPRPGMVFDAVEKYNLDLSQSFVVGDGLVDIGLGENVGCRTILVGDNVERGDKYPEADFKAVDILEAVKIILEETKEDNLK